MPKLIVAAFFIVVVFNASSQSKQVNEIVAEGGAKTKVKPDLATFTLTIEKTDTIEKAAIMQLNKAVDGLVSSLSLIGFKNNDIKIASYDISSSIYHEDNKKRYTASNEMKVSFRIDGKLIDAFYTEIQQAGIEDLDVSFETSLSDSLEKAIRLKLVQQAIADAKTNATNIVQALGIRIGKVKQVHKYSEPILDIAKIEMIKFTPPVIKKDAEIKYSTPFNKFQVEETELEEKETLKYFV